MICDIFIVILHEFIAVDEVYIVVFVLIFYVLSFSFMCEVAF